jgi:PIN domain nuclease of toxin-antitoxin system
MSEVIVLDTHIWLWFIATALVYGSKLASVDSLFSRYPEIDAYLMK